MRVRLLHCVALGVMWTLSACPATLAQAANESFEYEPNVSLLGLNGGSGWTTYWFTGDPYGAWHTSSEGLSFAGMSGSGGSVVPFDAAECVAARGVETGGSGLTTYFSYLVRVPAAGDQAVALGFYGDMAAFSTGLMQVPSGEMAFGIGADPGFAVAEVPFVAHRTYLVTGSFYVDPGASPYVTASLWADPFAPLSTLYLDVPGDWSGGITAITLQATGSSGYLLDEIYVGPDPRYPVVPEAGTLASLAGMVGLGGIGLLRRLQRRNRG